MTDLKKKMHMANGEAVPAEILGPFQSFLGQTKPGSSLQAGKCEHCGRGESNLSSPGAEVAGPEEQSDHVRPRVGEHSSLSTSIAVCLKL